MISIPLTKGYIAQVDYEDADLFMLSWFANMCGTKVYACKTHRDSDGNRVTLYLHRLLAERIFGDIPDGMRVEHDNWNTMDNSRKNIKLLTHGENIAHRDKIRSSLWCPPNKAWDIVRAE